MRCGPAPWRETFQPRAVDQKNIQPAVVVVVIEGDATASGFEQVLVLVLATVDGFCVEPRLSRDVQKADPKLGTGRRFWFRGRLQRQATCTGSERTDER